MKECRHQFFVVRTLRKHIDHDQLCGIAPYCWVDAILVQCALCGERKELDG